MTDTTDPGFAPADLTDDRKAGEWQTRYHDPNAKKQIRCEAIYLAAHLFGVVLAVIVLAVLSERNVTDVAGQPKSPIPTSVSNPGFGWEQILHAWLGGVLGGAVFSIKWLVHVLAKNRWNIDRRFWRFFTPHVSGALAFAFVILMASGLVVIIDKESLTSVWVCFGLGFLVGYFSDNATAKLTEIARTLFGSTKRPESTDDRQDDGPTER